jgi:hypothetical protein
LDSGSSIRNACPASDIKAGGRPQLWLDTAKVHLFDPREGHSLTVERARRPPARSQTPWTIG